MAQTKKINEIENISYREDFFSLVIFSSEIYFFNKNTEIFRNL